MASNATRTASPTSARWRCLARIQVRSSKMLPILLCSAPRSSNVLNSARQNCQACCSFLPPTNVQQIPEVSTGMSEVPGQQHFSSAELAVLGSSCLQWLLCPGYRRTLI